jgi:hypothetical protein
MGISLQTEAAHVLGPCAGDSHLQPVRQPGIGYRSPSRHDGGQAYPTGHRAFPIFYFQEAPDVLIFHT